MTSKVRSQPITWPQHLPGDWQTQGKLRSYLGRNLTVYLDGGADIVFETGFHALYVQSYANDSEEIIGEVYEMTSKLAAFGMFYRLRHKDPAEADLGVYSAKNNWQLLFVRDSIVVRIANYSGKPECRKAMHDLAEIISAQLPKTTKIPDLITLLPGKGLVKYSRRIISGRLSLREVTTLFSADQLKLGSEGEGICASYGKGDGSNLLLIIRYKNRQHLDQVVNKLKNQFKMLETESGSFKFNVKGQAVSITLKNNNLWINIQAGHTR